jgi:class 3 adenylate cyclase
MPHATVTPVSGDFGPDDIEEVVAVLHPFLGLELRPPELDTVLATVLFTDIVGSTAKQAALGDHAWKKLVERHHAMVRDALTKWRGAENDTAGDGFYATFEGLRELYVVRSKSPSVRGSWGLRSAPASTQGNAS